MHSDFKLPEEWTISSRNNDLLAIAAERVRVITKNREEILEAFIAKYGYDPDRIVQVIQRTQDGEKFFVRMRTQEEMEMLSRISSSL